MKLYEFLLHWGKKKPDSLFYRGDDFTMTWGEALKEMEEEKEWMGSHMPASSLLAIYMHRNENSSSTSWRRNTQAWCPSFSMNT